MIPRPGPTGDVVLSEADAETIQAAANTALLQATRRVGAAQPLSVVNDVVPLYETPSAAQSAIVRPRGLGEDGTGR